MNDITTLLRNNQIQPTPQRIATANVALNTQAHLSADEIWERVKQECPTVSRATVYNTLNLFVEKQLLKTQILKEGKTIFDSSIQQHHHFIDESGEVHDIPWEALRVEGQDLLEDFEISEYQVVLRGRRKKQ